MATPSRPVPVLFRPFRGGRVAKHILLIGFGLVMLYPLLWMISSSLKPEELIFREPGLLPSQITFENYTEGWYALKHPFGYYLWNSAVVTAISVVANLVACSLAAYAFARLNFPLKKFWFAIMLGTIMLPHHVTIVPQYIMFSELGLINTIWPLVMPKILATDAFFIFLMVQFIRTLPRELDEAAEIDGAGYWRIYIRVVMPLCMPALATTAIFTFIWTWNDFLSQLLYLNNPDNFTVPVALRTFLDASSDSSWGPMFAMSIIALGPIFGFFLAGQKYLIRGVATTGLK
ncbi:carbohydrate ABC transporter permease [[Actinomadura] parvosata]|uniref:Sugar ABC transporter permease n=2 Tax=Nonomuraea TaxID=83681 RepID=A0A1V0A831_9ACTN|nr:MULTISPECIES: carbohydrate ABC transporter permease [unclassified Nonomuraea]AQZ66361.1 sugar ABC transporter permease [Nonomuraea sp. ATCC 55076]NJP89447.1 carbohydrate ABC transporter permease [Nonomuraea sp. FMUSA5-5]